MAWVGVFEGIQCMFPIHNITRVKSMATRSLICMLQRIYPAGGVHHGRSMHIHLCLPFRHQHVHRWHLQGGMGACRELAGRVCSCRI